MGYGIAPNASHFTGKKGKTIRHRKKKVKTKRVHKNKYAIKTK